MDLLQDGIALGYYPDSTFTKIFHLKDEIGIYISFDDRTYGPTHVPIIYFRELILDNNNRYYLNTLDNINDLFINSNGKYILDSCLYCSDAIKLNDSKFVVILTMKTTNNLLICFFDILNDSYSLPLILRYYILELSLINIKITVNLRTFNYKDNFGLIFYDSNCGFPGYIFFNYPKIVSDNKTDSRTIAIKLFNESPHPYYFSKKDNIKISNNFYGGKEGIKIIKYLSPSITGIIIKSLKLNLEISTNQIIYIDDTIIFESTSDGVIPGNYTLEFYPITYITNESTYASETKYYNNLEEGDYNGVIIDIFSEKAFKLIYRVECYEKCKTCSQLGNEYFYYCVKCLDEKLDVINNGEKCECLKYKYINEEGKNICLEDCNEDQYKYIISESEKYCLTSCSYNDEVLYKDESSNICYDDCSKNINGNNMLYNNMCVRECPQNYISNNNICTLNEYSNEIISESENNYPDSTDRNIISDNCLIDINLLIENYLNNNSSNLEVMQKENCSIIYYCYSSKSNIYNLSLLNPNLTFISITDCEQKLIKEHYLTQNSELIILGKQEPSHSENSVIYDFDYQIHFDNGTILDKINLCNNTKLEMLSPMNNYLSEETYEKASLLSEQGYDIFNISSSFYFDICSSAYLNDSDLSMSVRINDIMPDNISFCLDGCTYKGVDLVNKRFICLCSWDFNNKEDNSLMNYIEEVEENFFIYIKDLINYEIFICYKLVTNSNNYNNNFGFYFGAAILTLILIFFFLFCCLGSNSIVVKFLKNEPNLNKKTNFKIMNKNNNKRNPNSQFFGINNKNNNKIIINNKVSSKVNLNRNNLNNNVSVITIKKYTNKNNSTNIKNRRNKNVIVNKQYNINNFNINLNGHKNSQRKKLGNSMLINSNEFMIKKSKTNVLLLNSNKINYNDLTFSKAIEDDKRTIVQIFLSFLLQKFEFIQLTFYPKEFSHISLTFSLYIFEILLDVTINSLLFSDDVISQKYYNNGELLFFTSNILSISSNIIVCSITYLIGILINYYEILEEAKIETNKKKDFYKIFLKIYYMIRLRIYIFYSLLFLIGFGCTYYLFIFCSIYKRIQIKLLENNILSSVWSFCFTIGICILVTIFRKIALIKKFKRLYIISRYIDEKF